VTFAGCSTRRDAHRTAAVLSTTRVSVCSTVSRQATCRWYGLLALRREPAERTLPPADHRLVARFLALTAINPATAATFAGLMLGLPAVAHASAPGKAAFVVGAFGASLAWQSTLAGGGALMRHRLPPSARTWTSVVGRLLVLGLAVRLALGA
jgi:arginine exporter protein ArgO